jgi:hypothetical protein
VLIEFCLDLFGSPDQDDANTEIARSLYGSLDLAGWSIIATHRVHSDLKHKPLIDCRFPIVDFRFPVANFRFARGSASIGNRQSAIQNRSYSSSFISTAMRPR